MQANAAAIAFPASSCAAAQRASGVVLAVFLLLFILMEVTGSGVKTYLHGDGLGSVVAVTTSGGAVQAIKAYGPYGECANAGAASLWGYAGRLYDPETNLYDNRARAYSTAQGRFLQPDPIGTQGGMNLYAYVNNDPLNLTDPSGLCAAALGNFASSAFNSVFGANPAYGMEADDPFDKGTEGAHASHFGGGISVPTQEVGPRDLGKPARDVIEPTAVRFSQSSISRMFSTGSSIDEMAAGLRSGSIKSSDIPPIRLVEREGQLFTLDNRRLEAFRRAGAPIPYRMASPEEAAAEVWKFTTRNNGSSVRVRGE